MRRKGIGIRFIVRRKTTKVERKNTIKIIKKSLIRDLRSGEMKI